MKNIFMLTVMICASAWIAGSQSSKGGGAIFATPIECEESLAGNWYCPGQELSSHEIMIASSGNNTITTPVLHHHVWTETVKHDEIEKRECPVGTEGHLVVMSAGFTGPVFPGSTYLSAFSGNSDAGELMYTVCFDDTFIKQISQDKDMRMSRPGPVETWRGGWSTGAITVQ